MSNQSKHFYDFDKYRLDATNRLLLRGGEMVPLTQRAFDVLLALVERQGEVVSKEELLRQVWADSFVEEGNLTQNIYTLRRTLGKAEDGDDYIHTIPRRGYRFVARVTRSQNNGDTVSIPEPVPEVVKSLTREGQEPGGSGAGQSNGEGFLHTAAEKEASTAGELTPATLADNAYRVSATVFNRRKPLLMILLLTLAAGLIGLGIWSLTVAQKDKPPTVADGQMTVTSLTNTGNVQCVAISADGKYVAYAVADRQQSHSLWLMQVSTLSTRQLLATAEAMYYAITFTPAGDFVYYVKQVKGESGRALFRVPLVGGAEKRVLDQVSTGVSFSRDGRQLVFRRSYNDRRENVLIIADADGGNERELAAISYPETMQDPAWSPDGKTIACAVGRTDGGLNMSAIAINVSDGRRQQISSQRWRWIGQMAWLANGSGLVMVASEMAAAPYQVWQLGYPDGETRKITNDSNFYNRLSMSADGRSIVAQHRKQITSMWLIPRQDARSQRQITYGAGGVRGRVSWTPDGRIVFDSYQGSATTMSILDLNSGAPRQLTGDTTGQEVTSYATASPDGRYIVYTSDIAGRRHLWRMNIDGSNAVQVTNGEGEDHPAVSPDGKWIIYTRLEGDQLSLWRVAIDGGEPVQVTDTFTAYPTISPDGKWIACLYSDLRPDWRWQIALIPAEGGRPVKIFPNRVEGSTLLQWLPDGKSLSYAENLSGVSKVWIQAVDGGEPQQFVEFENDRLFGFSWSPDGKQLACVRGFWSGDAVLIKDFQ